MFKKPIFLLALVLATASVIAAPGEIVTLAGRGNGDGAAATAALLRGPGGLRLDAAGNIYVADTLGHRIRRIDAATGVITTIAGLGTAGFSGDGGQATVAMINSPGELTFDAAGNLFFSDTENYRIRRIDAATGVITTLVGKGTCDSTGDGGPLAAAAVCRPAAIAVNAAGDMLIGEGNRVRKVANGTITTVAGGHFVGHCGLNAGGPATAAQFNGVMGLAWDGSGGYYVADTHNRWICHVDAAGIIRVAAGRGPFTGSQTAPVADGPVATTEIGAPTGLALDSVGNLYFAEGFGHVVRRLSNGVVTRVAGSHVPDQYGFNQGGFSGDGGPATAARLDRPNKLAVDGAGNLLIADSLNLRVRKVVGGTIDTVVGRTPVVGDGGPALSADLRAPGGALRMASGDLYISETSSHRVRRVDGSGVISTAAGTGIEGSFGASNDPALGTTVRLSRPRGLARDSSDRLLIADAGAHRVRRLDAAGMLTTFAGTGSCCLELGQTGPAAQGQLYEPASLGFDAAGNLYISGFEFFSGIRKVDTSGILSTINGGQLAGAVVADAAGNLFVALPTAHRIRRIDTTGAITDFAGSGVAGFSGDGGPALAATFNTPSGLALDADGTLYVADLGNHRVRAISPAGEVRTVAGNGVPAFAGDGGPALAASLIHPTSVSVDAANQLLIADQGNDRIRSVHLADVTPAPFAFASQSGVAVASPVQSAAVTLSGFDAPTPITVTGGEYSIGCNGTFTAAAGTIGPGASVCVRHTSAARFNDDATTTLVVGGRPATFLSTTALGPGDVTITPASVDFGAQSMNTTAPAIEIAITNPGASPMTVNAVTLPAGAFATTHDCAALAAGASCTVRVTFTPPQEGTLAATLTLRLSSGYRQVALAGVGEKSLAVHYYRSILRRAPDAAGRAFWNEEATRLAGLGASATEVWFAMAMNFYFSAEYTAFNRDDTAFLTDLYNTFFNRAPEPAGLSFWQQQLAAGLPREVVLAGFMFSPEFVGFATAIFGSTAARAEVNTVMDFYRGLLARTPETAGFNAWVQRFRTAQCAVSTARASAVRAEMEAISSEFINSGEYLGRNRTNAQFVGDLYNAFFRRGGERAGVQAWVNHLNNGLTRDQVRQAFISTPEFGGRVQAIITQGCLQ